MFDTIEDFFNVNPDNQDEMDAHIDFCVRELDKNVSRFIIGFSGGFEGEVNCSDINHCYIYGLEDDFFNAM